CARSSAVRAASCPSVQPRAARSRERSFVLTPAPSVRDAAGASRCDPPPSRARLRRGTRRRAAGSPPAPAGARAAAAAARCAVRRARSGPTDRKRRTQPELRLTDVIDALRWNVLPGILKTTAVVQGFLRRTRRRPRTVLGDVHAVVRDLHDAGCKLREPLHPG